MAASIGLDGGMRGLAVGEHRLLRFGSWQAALAIAMEDMGAEAI